MKRDFEFKCPINGQKRLFYDVKSNFTSASTLEKLLSKISYKPKVNITAIEDFIWTSSLHPEETFYYGINRVPPGYKLFIENNKIKIKRWWKPENIKIDHTISFDKAKEKFKILFEEAIQECISNKETVGCELSGGFDSSSVFAIASRHKSKIVALTMDFKGGNADEREYASSVFHYCSKDYDQHYRIRSDLIDYKNKYNMKYNYNLNPHWPIWTTFTMKAPLIEYLVENEIDTVLTGQFGDNLLYSSDKMIMYNLYQKKIFKFIKELFYLDNPLTFISREVKKYFLSLINNDIKYYTKKLIKKKEKEKRKYDFYMDLKTFKDREINKRIINLLTNANFYMYIDSSISKASSDRFNINFCSPFANQKFIEFMLKVPPEYLYSKGNRRYFHAMVMKDILPKQIINRKDKASFSQTILEQINAIDRKQLWKKSTIISMEIVTYEYIMKLEEQFEKKTISSQDRSLYWRMINIEYWYALNPYLDKSEFAPNPYVLESCKE